MHDQLTMRYLLISEDNQHKKEVLIPDEICSTIPPTDTPKTYSTNTPVEKPKSLKNKPLKQKQKHHPYKKVQTTKSVLG